MGPVKYTKCSYKLKAYALLGKHENAINTELFYLRIHKRKHLLANDDPLSWGIQDLGLSEEIEGFPQWCKCHRPL